ncbi:hypothetical protein [Winogradskyella sp. PG-2]|uniref:hypothetical protein n=1 Tax=Winogradskyella sp. PG-2 TaxID=754409 RepID=UPI0004586C37|nr:hypothetical protein [Winogradskyella sp. PG-2]BAO74807.1 hypothetical protein WPG_0577 [Winogradskyella sp. PG-2]
MKTTTLSILVFLLLSTSVSFSQTEIKAPKGYSNDIGNMISMLDNLKGRVERNVRNLEQ